MSERRSLHPAAWLAGTLEGLRNVLLPAAVVFVAGGPDAGSALFIGLASVAVSAVIGLLQWQTTHYWFAEGALHFQSGVLSPDRKMIPAARVTAVDEVRGIAQRLFGVTAVHVQTAGGGAQGEIVLAALSRADADELRARLDRAVPPAGPLRPPAAWRLSPGRLVVAAVTGPQLSVVIPLAAGAVGGLLQFGGDEQVGRLLAWLPHDRAGWEVLSLYVLAAVFGLALLGSVIAFAGFTATRADARLRIQRGMIERRAASVDAARVHAVRVVESLLRRPLGLCSIRMEVAGYANEPSVAQTLVPLCRRSEVSEILARLLPELPVPDSLPLRSPARALPAHLLPPLLGAAGLSGAVALAVAGGAPEALWPAVPAALAAAVAVGAARWRAAAAGEAGARVAVSRHHVFARVLTVADARRLQHVDLRAGPGQRRRGLRSVGLAVASGHATRAAHLAEDDGRRLFAALRAQAVPRQPTGSPTSRATSSA